MIHPQLVEEKKKYKETAPWGLIMYEIVINTKPDLILEIGTRNGFSTRIFLSALDCNKKGILHSVDKKDCVQRANVPDNLKKYWQFHQANSLVFYKQWQKEIDILLIDGDHRYTMAKSDFLNYEKFVKPGGWIFMHDTVQWEGVKKFWPEIKYPKVNFDWGDGMGLIRKI